MYSVQHIITRHDCPYAGFPDSPSESRQIDFMERSFIDIRTRMVTVVFLIVTGKMFDCSHHALRLHTTDIADGRF